MKRLAVLATAGGIATMGLLAAPVSAHTTGPCEGHDYGNHGADVWVAPSIGVVSIGGLAYVDDRNLVNGNGLWFYVESNGEGGLQRGGSAPTGDADICQESSNPDTLIF